MLLGKGVSQLSAIVISITLALLGGLVLEGQTRLWLKSRAAVIVPETFRIVSFTQAASSQQVTDAARFTTASVALYVVALSMSSTPRSQAYQLSDTAKTPFPTATTHYPDE